MLLVRLCTTTYLVVRTLLLVSMIIPETMADPDYPVDADYPLDADSDEDLYKFAEPGEFPYVVFLTSKAGWCTGVILSELWVLTTANCLYDGREKPLKDQAVTIRAGIYDHALDGVTTVHEQMRTSLKIKFHDNFVLKNVAKYNVALIKVREAFEFGPFVNSINVSGYGWPQTKDKLRICTAFGYGSYYTTSVESTVLKYWSVNASHGEKACPCLKRFQWKRLICVREEGRPRMCQADCGGPLICDGAVVALGHMVWDRNTCDDAIYPLQKCRGDPNSDPELKHGITSFYFLCPLNDWIRKYVPQVPGTPASCRAPTILQHPLFILVAFIITFTNVSMLL